MQVRTVVSLGVALAIGLLSQGARAASYQQIDGTIIDPITYCCTGGNPPYDGPDLALGVVSIGARLVGAQLPFANLVDSDLRQAYLYDANLSSADLTQANLRSADLTNADLSGAILVNTTLEQTSFNFANLTGADLSGANLHFADLSTATLTGAVFVNAIYGQGTQFPNDFDPFAAGMTTGPILINNGLAPPTHANVIDSAYIDYVINNSGCNALVAYPCVSPGASTSVSGTGNNIWVHETSEFNGVVHGDITVRDSSAASVVMLSWGGSASASSTSSLNVVAGGLNNNLGAGGEAYVHASGGGWYDAGAGGRAHLLFHGSTDYGGTLSVSGSALLEVFGDSFFLSAEGGRAVLHPGSSIGNAAFVRQAGILENRGGSVAEDYPMTVEGTYLQMSGEIEEGGIGVTGYASISDGFVDAQEQAEGGGITFFKPGPWNFWSGQDGVIELLGSTLGEFVSLGARDTSRIRIFGNEFTVAGQPIPFGTIPSPTGLLSGTLSSGDPIQNTFGHQGADCGGRPCTGRILVLAPGLDWDQDAVPNAFDNCAEEPNADQTDTDTNGTGDVCFAPMNLDRDAVIDAVDNCRVDANPDQADADSDGVGDACDDSLVVWTDPGTSGCTSPPQPAPYSAVTSDLGTSDVIDRSEQPCDCMGLEYPVEPGVASVRFLHVSPNGVVKEVCENAAPYALGLAPGQPLCSTSLAQDGAHAVMVTPYDAPGCEAGEGEAMPSSIRKFAVVPEPGTALMLGVGVIGLAALGRSGRKAGMDLTA